MHTMRTRIFGVVLISLSMIGCRTTETVNVEYRDVVSQVRRMYFQLEQENWHGAHVRPVSYFEPVEVPDIRSAIAGHISVDMVNNFGRDGGDSQLSVHHCPKKGKVYESKIRIKELEDGRTEIAIRSVYTLMLPIRDSAYEHERMNEILRQVHTIKTAEHSE